MFHLARDPESLVLRPVLNYFLQGRLVNKKLNNLVISIMNLLNDFTEKGRYSFSPMLTLFQKSLARLYIFDILEAPSAIACGVYVMRNIIGVSNIYTTLFNLNR